MDKRIAVLLKEAGIYPRKRLGQHFLKDKAICQKILAACDLEKEDVVIEIGAGLGVLTLPLSRSVKKVFAIELDERIAKLLKYHILPKGTDSVEVIEENALDFDFHGVSKQCGKRLKVVANLPYGISTPILFKLLESRNALSLAVLMFQKEVSDRIVANPGSKSYGILSVLTQYFAKTGQVMIVSPKSFYPQPKVDSAVVKLRFGIPLKEMAEDEALFIRVVKAAFGKRRKILRNTLSSGLNLSLQGVENVLDLCGIDGHRRAETLSVEEFVRLSNSLKGTYPVQ